MFRSSVFDKSLESATSNLILEPDWEAIMVICDTVRQGDVSAKHAIQALKKKMFSQNPHTALYALLVLESLVKNCGAPIHEEITNKENCEMFQNLVNTTQHEEVRTKMLELIQAWAYAFRTFRIKYRCIRDTMNILKTEGHIFPELKEADAMFSSDIAPNWLDGDVCHRCRAQFSFTFRKHHCRNCGQVFCAQCSSKTCTLPKFGIEKEVRVCDGCYAQLQRPTATLTKKPTEEEDLPAEYLGSSLAQQAQAPARKTEEELREEEEIQLALAISQSEADCKQASQARRTTYKASSPEPAPAKRSPSPVEETPTDPELARYLNRNYWEQRQMADSPASPSAPSPMPSPMPSVQPSLLPMKSVTEDVEIDDFSNLMKTQVEIFVNRMKSNSCRGRSISCDSSVQTLFMNMTSMHSRLLTFIKDMDDKRMWYEQLQDKLTQIKDSRAALDVLRQEHLDKLRRIAEEQERQRQLQMAQKLEFMRKKKQEYLQYQRQLALQRIQEQEREMQMRQEQQKAQYRMGTAFPFMSPPGQGQPQGSPVHVGVPGSYAAGYPYAQMPQGGTLPHYHGGQPPMFSPQHGGQFNLPPVAGGENQGAQIVPPGGIVPPGMNLMPGQVAAPGGAMNMPAGPMMGQQMMPPAPHPPQQQQPPSMGPVAPQPPPIQTQTQPPQQQPQQPSQLPDQAPQPPQQPNPPQMQSVPVPAAATAIPAGAAFVPGQTPVAAPAPAPAPAPPQAQAPPPPAAAPNAPEPATAELISFD